MAPSTNPFPYPTMTIPSATSGIKYRMHMLANGIVSLTSRVFDDPTSAPMRSLVNDERTQAFRFEINDTDVANPRLILRTIIPQLGRAYLTIFGTDGREWEITCRMDSTGLTPIYSVKAISEVPVRLSQPTVIDLNNVVWHFQLTDGGIYQIQSDIALPVVLTGDTPYAFYLRSKDDLAAYAITVGLDGFIHVDPIDLELARYYDAELVSDGGLHATLTVDKDGILAVDTAWQETLDGRDEWPLVISQHGNYIYVSDDRFPPPIPAMPRRWGQRRRRWPTRS